MDIGSAKPSKAIQKKAPHHLIDILNPDEPFTAQQYKRLAESSIDDILKRKKIPMLVGGAGFYMKAIAKPVSSLPAGRSELKDPEAAYQMLIDQDPGISVKIHPNDHDRISRAMYLLEKGILPSVAYQTDEQIDLPFDIIWLGIQCARPRLRKQIEERVHQMFDQGIVKETKDVLEEFPDARPRLQKAIGYKESIAVLDKEMTEKEAIAQTTIHTQQFAKRQDTWFRKNTSIIWSEYEDAVESFSVSIPKLVQV